MGRGAPRVAQTERHFHLLARHHELVAEHRVLREKPFDQQEHTAHKRALGDHLTTLIAHRLNAKSI